MMIIDSLPINDCLTDMFPNKSIKVRVVRAGPIICKLSILGDPAMGTMGDVAILQMSTISGHS